MNRFLIHTLFASMFLFTGNLLADEINENTLPGIQEEVKEFLDNRSGKKIDEKDKSIMVKAAQDLDRAMPDPGLRVGEKAPDFTLVNAFGKEVKLHGCKAVVS